jgi:A/G-specific adenine glycosylase
LRWFDAHQRDLPWRHTRDPYAIWVSEVMLQQTQVATVIPYWHDFLARFPTVAALARADTADVLAGWRGLGYYSRARNLKAAAEQVIAEHGGELPSTAEALRTLPGFGRYTAGAVASIAFGEASPLVDGNVARVLSRLFEVEGAPGDKVREARLWQLAGQLVEGPRPGDLNQALMELGALVCRVEAPTCPACPARRVCLARASGRVAELPPKKVRAPRKPLCFAVAVFRRRGALLLGRRAEKGLFGGLWELPCAEVAPRVEPLVALAAAVGNARLGPALGTVRRTLTHRDLELRLFLAKSLAAPKALSGYQQLRWATAKQAEALGMSTAMQRAFALALSSP